MKILLYLNRYPGGGGIETMTAVLSKLFAIELGHEIFIFSVYGQEGFTQAKPSWLKELFIASNHKEENYIYHFEKFMENNKFDIVIFQDSYADIHLPLLEAKQKYNFKLITCEHNTPDCHLIEYRNRWKTHSWTNAKGLLRKMAYPFVYNKMLRRIGKRHKLLIDASDAYILLSESYKDILKKYWSIESSNVAAIPNIKNDFGCPSFDLNSVSKKRQAIFVGRLTPNKGINYLIEIWDLIERSNPEWNLKIIGDGEMREYVECQIKERNLKNVSLEGFQNDIDRYYKESSILLMTSIFEGLPLVLVEAMQFGVIPIVFDSFGSARDIITGGTDGFLIKPYDVDSYVSSFSELINKEDLITMQNAAISHSKRFTASAILSRWQKLICDLV